MGYGPNRVAGCGIAKAYFGPSYQMLLFLNNIYLFLFGTNKLSMLLLRGYKFKNHE